MRDIWRATRASVVGFLVSGALLTGWLALPQSVAACSCATDSLVEFAKFPDVVVFSGTVGAADPAGIQVAVDTWFHGSGIAPIVHLDPRDLGSQSSSCGVPVPPPGSRYLFAGGRTPPAGLIELNLCTPHGDVSTPGGQALMAEALKAFPGAQVLPKPAPIATDALSTMGGVAPYLALGTIGVVGVGLVLLVVVVGRRLRAPD
ncbi:MAG TPA: hypothetical protein VF323_01425 [Candidatus Limnocylindrales bacterium]